LTAFGSVLKSELKSGGNFETYFKQLQREQEEENLEEGAAKKDERYR